MNENINNMNDNNNVRPSNGSNSLTALLCVIIVILIAAIGVLLLGKGTEKEESKSKEEAKEEVKEEVKEEIVLEETEEVNELYKMIPSGFKEDGINIYQGRLIKIDDLTAEDLGFTVYGELVENYMDEVIASVDSFDGEPVEEDYDKFKDYVEAYTEKCIAAGHIIKSSLTCYVKGAEPNGWDAYSSETVEKIYKNFYGSKFNYSNPATIGNAVGHCNYYDEYYLCEEGGGYGPGGNRNYTQFQKLVKHDEEAYIYVKYLNVVEVCDSEYDNCYHEVYTDYNGKNKIGRENDADYDFDFFKKYGDKALTYKHTYKRNGNGSYYWYSVELVK